jgi:ArsR family transcriptional regulator, lead/cadmium/zinc/bismuth-responsive transcriptional repressor
MSRRSDIRSAPSARSAAAALDACDVLHLDPSKVARLRNALIEPAVVDGLAETFKALGDPTRVRMLDALSHGELCVCDLAQLIGLSQSATSHQLRLLRQLRIVRSRRAGRMVFYALDDRHVVSLVRQGLRHAAEDAPRARRRPA